MLCLPKFFKTLVPGASVFIRILLCFIDVEDMQPCAYRSHSAQAREKVFVGVVRILFIDCVSVRRKLLSFVHVRSLTPGLSCPDDSQRLRLRMGLTHPKPTQLYFIILIQKGALHPLSNPRLIWFFISCRQLIIYFCTIVLFAMILYHCYILLYMFLMNFSKVVFFASLSSKLY